MVSSSANRQNRPRQTKPDGCRERIGKPSLFLPHKLKQRSASLPYLLKSTTPHEASPSSSYLMVSSLLRPAGVATKPADPVAVSPAACGVSLPEIDGSVVLVAFAMGSLSAAALVDVADS